VTDENTPNDAVLEVRDLRTVFVTDHATIPAVDGVSLRIPHGKTVALVGESGCGKSVTALSLMRLIPSPPGRIIGGEVLLAGQGEEAPIDLLRLTRQEICKVRGGRIAMIFQDPMTSLNPVYTVGEQIVEAIELHQPLRGKDAWSVAIESLRKVGIPSPDHRAKDYPHTLSGGMLQRAMIAMALSCKPSLLIADEPTTALDVTIQLQTLDLLRRLQRESGMSILLITHDFGVVAEITDYVYVMYAGRIVEHGPVNDMLATPLHPYTQGLLGCVPRLSSGTSSMAIIPGTVPDPADYPRGCRFHPRCGLSAKLARETDRHAVDVRSDVGDRVLRSCVQPEDRASSSGPPLREVHPGHFVACNEVVSATCSPDTSSAQPL
jgi:oligopeptide/dipeptide ABC transporter ATP-binding protein